MTTLKGMTWRHPRGFDPMVATSREWQSRTGTVIEWEQRSLQDFESYPVEDLARTFDLIVVDHPHVGQITNENCLIPLDRPERADALAEMARGSIGRSFASYAWQGRQWALPIDAATQVQAYRVDAMDRGVATWSDMLDMARDGRVLLPMRSPHSLMSFYTLAANLGTPCASDHGAELIDVEAGAVALEALAEIMAHVRQDAWDMDPIAAFEVLAAGEGREVVVPLAYGYISYATDGFRPHRLAFCDIPVLGHTGPSGSALGGTGIAVSAYSTNPDAALDYAFWVAGPEIQRTLYAHSGGQAGIDAAWVDDRINHLAHGFYRDTRATLEAAWMRPRYDGYMRFQQEGSEIIRESITGAMPGRAAIEKLNLAFKASAAAV